MVRVALGTWFATVIVLGLPAIALSEESEAPPALTVCQLLRSSTQYSSQTVRVRGVFATNGLDEMIIGDPACVHLGAIRVAENATGAADGNVTRLFETVQLAFLSSTLKFRVMIKATVVGVFAKPMEVHARPEIRIRDAESLLIVPGRPLVPQLGKP